MKSVIVTGASGFIGRQVVRCLVENGYQTHCITTQTIEQASQINDRVIWHRVNLKDYGQIEKVFKSVGAKFLIHLAWNVKGRSYKNSEDNLNWIGSTLKILMEFERNGGEKAVFAGTCFEYDLSQKELKENSAELKGINLYGVCKASLSRIIKKFCQDKGMDYAWARIFYCFGPNESEDRIIPHVTINLLKNQSVTVSNKDQYLDYLSVEDVGRAFYEILSSDITGEVNIGSGEGVNLKELIKAVGKILSKEELIQFSDDIAVKYPKVVANNNKLREYTKWSFEKDLNVKLEENINWWKEYIENERKNFGCEFKP